MEKFINLWWSWCRKDTKTTVQQDLHGDKSYTWLESTVKQRDILSVNHLKDTLLTTEKPDNISDNLQQFLSDKYYFRYNLLSEQTEYCEKNRMANDIYIPVNQRDLNTFCLEARANHINCWDKDVSRLLNSKKVESYHPFLYFMDNLPEWDGTDRVAPLAERISFKPLWVKGFHRWMLGVAAQWLGQAEECANAVAPMLVSREQGKRKSSFCKMLMPKELLPYYIDKFDLTSESGCEQKLSLFGIINMD